MTWNWDVQENDLLVWGHTQNPDSDAPLQTISNKDGWGWDDYPSEVLNLMYSEAKDSIDNQEIERAVTVALDMADERIERVE